MLLSVESLVKHFGRRRVLSEINFQIEEGEAVGLVGPNGSGKTTLIRSLLGFYKPRLGKVLFDGKPWRSDPEQWRRVAYVPSTEALLGTQSAREFLLWCASFYPQDQSSLQLRLENWAQRLHLDLRQRFDRLSRGDQRKVALLRALIPQADFLVMDEPTVGLDPLASAEFFHILTEQRQENPNLSLLISSHELGIIEAFATRILFIREGQLIKNAEMTSIMLDSPEYIEIVFSSPELAQTVSLLGTQNISRKGACLLFGLKTGLSSKEFLTSLVAQEDLWKEIENIYIYKKDLAKSIYQEYKKDLHL